MVNVNGDTDLVSLWIEVREYLVTRHGRRKLLEQWVNDLVARKPASYEDLADTLDQEIKDMALAKQWRKRPAFTPAIIAHFNQTWGGTRHRRHIVMSSVMREAVYRVTDVNDSVKVLPAYNKLLKMVGFSLPTSTDAAETQLVIVLHNNPANLVLDTGSWNSAIGSLATNVRKALTQGIDPLWLQYKADPQQFFQSQVKGFQPEIQKEIVQFWQGYAHTEVPQNADDLQELLFDMYDNAAVDLLSKQQIPNKDLMPKLLECHIGFELAYSTGKLENLYNVCQAFINLGLKYAPLPYSKVFS